MARLARIAGLVTLALWLSQTAVAQRNPHGMAQGPRPLQERLPAAAVVVVGQIESVEEGRVHVRAQTRVRGEVSDTFEIKRSPARPPRVEAGDTALLLLRGARSPYVLVDQPQEIQLLESPREAALWADAVRAVASREKEELLNLYAEWIDGPSQTLREEAARAIAFPDAGFMPLPAAFVDGRVAAALDPARTDDQRRLSARIASTDQRGLDALIAGLPAPDDPSAAGAFEEALRIGNVIRLPAGRDALLRGLRHPSPEVQLVAVSMSRPYFSDAEVRDALLALKDSDDERLTETLQRVIDRASRMIHP